MDRIFTAYSSTVPRPLRLMQRLGALMALGRSRRRLGQLDDHLLRDIGLSSSAARREAEKPLWVAPQHWLR